MSYTSILTETRGRVGLVTLNRPEAMNALNPTILRELMEALEAFDADDAIGAMVVLRTGTTGILSKPLMRATSS